jgi:PAS domain S-box-containing protein
MTDGSPEQMLREEMDGLRERLRDLRERLREPEDLLRAIREGEVDAFVVRQADGERIYSLRTAETLYRALVEEMNGGAAVIDASGTVVYCNPFLAGLLGLSVSGVVGSAAMLLVAPDSRSFFDFLRQDSASGGRREIELQRPDGELVPVSAALTRIRLEESDVFGLVVTDLRGLRRRQELLDQNVRKDGFLATLAHELRNPLAAIRNAVDVMADPEGAADAEEYRRIVDRQVAHLTRLLDDILDIQRSTHGVLGLKTEPLDFAAVVEAAIEALRGTAAARSQTIELEREPDALPVAGDPTRLAQIVSNLLVNALKYSSAGSKVRVTLRAVGQQAELRVSDEGIGMPRELLARVFEPFVQGDRELSRTRGGLGLGLALVKRFVDLHGGTVEGASAGPGRGAEFTVRIPLASRREPVREIVPAPQLRRGPEESRRVLVVDDNTDAALTLSALLKLAGHRVESAADGPQAVQLARRFRPEVVLLDIGLPGMDGYAVARELHAIEGLAACALVAVTGFGRTEDRQRALESGFCAHLVKPVEYPGLLDLIRALPRADVETAGPHGA